MSEGIDEKMTTTAGKARVKKRQATDSILSEIFTTENADLPSDHVEKLPARKSEAPQEITSAICDLKNQVKTLVEKQSKEVSNEFKALMDGYVNKANESENYKVRFENIEEKHEELKVDFKELKDHNKRLNSDLEATREALRLSESDLQRNQKDFETYRNESNEQVHTLTEEKNLMKEKMRKLQEAKDEITEELQNKIDLLLEEQEKFREELLATEHRYKSLEQESNLEQENARRSHREAEGIIKELKEQLDLRTREVEYKDALLNQLVRQASTDKQALSQQVLRQGPGPSHQEKVAEHVYNPEESDENDDKSNSANFWGAFRK